MPLAKRIRSLARREQVAKAKVCEKGECEIETAKNTNRNDVFPQNK
jgi:repressor of nif and glnA expression